MIFLLDTVSISLIAVFSSLAFLAILIVAIVLFVNFKKNQIFNSYIKKYNDSKIILTSDCSKMLKRMEFLGNSNDDFKKNYLIRKQEYDTYVSSRNTYLDNLLNEIDNDKANRRNKEVENKIKEFKESTSTYNKDIQSFHDSLIMLLKDDNDAIEYSIPFKEKFRHIQDVYENNKDSLKYLEITFNAFFDNIKAILANNASLVNQAKYKEASDELNKIKPVLDTMDQIVSDLPSYCLSIYVVLPEEISKVNETYNRLLKEKYYLADLNVESIISSSLSNIETIKKKLNYFDTNGVNVSIEKIKNNIQDLAMKLNGEVEAKKKFIELQTTIKSDSNFDIEKQYSKLMRLLPEYQSFYVLDEKYVSQITDLKTDIDNIGEIKRELDFYTETNEKALYSKILNKAYSLLDDMKKINQTIDSYKAYLISLKNDSADIYKKIRDDYHTLDELSLNIKKTGIIEYIKVKNAIILKLKNDIVNLNNILTKRPVDVQDAKNLFIDIEKRIDVLSKEITIDIDLFRKANKNMTTGNLLRLDFSDSRDMLDEAYKYLVSGDFKKAYEISLNVINTFNLQESK